MINKNKIYWTITFVLFILFGFLLDLNISSLNIKHFNKSENIENKIAEINFTIFLIKKLGISNDRELIADILDQYLIGSYLKEPKYYIKTTSQLEISNITFDDIIKFQNLNVSNLSNFVNQIKVKLKIYSTNKDYEDAIKKLDKLYLFLKSEIEQKFEEEFINFIDYNFLNKYNMQIARIYDAALSTEINSGVINLDIDNIFMYEAFSNFVKNLSKKDKEIFLSKIKLNNNLSFEENQSNVYLYSNILENNEKLAFAYFDNLNIVYKPDEKITNTFPIITLAFIFLFLLLFLSIRVFQYK